MTSLNCSDTLEKVEKYNKMLPNGLKINYYSIIAYEGDVAVMANKIKSLNISIEAILPGAETGYTQ